MSKVFPGELSLSYGAEPFDIHLEAKAAGKDILAAVTGGTRPHIGAVSFAEPAGVRHPVTGVPAETDEPFPCVTVRTHTGFGHKDTILAEMFAEALCLCYGVNVCVAAGVHVDGAGKEEIERMVRNAEVLCGLITS